MSTDEQRDLNRMRSCLRTGLKECAVENLDVEIESYSRNSGCVNSEILDVVFSQIWESVEILQTGLDQSNFRTISQRAHTLKGLGGTIGAPELSVLGACLQMAADASSKSDCDALIDHLKQGLPANPNSSS